MLGKMLIHGLVAAALTASAAAVYAQAKDNGYLPVQAAPQNPEPRVDNGTVRPTAIQTRQRDEDRRHEVRSERHRDRHDRKRGHDDDDD